jgi:AcrR family transcriptional regulator
MMPFQRARSAEQRTERKRKILDTAATMLTEMPVAQVSLNELSRRVCLAKSNVLRYFESREAVLLELLDIESREWLARLDDVLTAAVDAGASPAERGDQLAAAIAASLAEHPVLCDLVSAQAAVLEHNVSPEVAGRFKRAAVASIAELSRLVRVHLGELGERDAGRFAGAAVVVTGAVWAYAHPSAAVLAVYDTDPSLAILRTDFTVALREILQVLLTGLLARPST